MNRMKYMKIVVACLCLAYSINSFAAVVSDNDGSAFITKAEFDSLKNNFQSQVDNYNQSIDSKIDGAIASYLAGIKVNTGGTPKVHVGGADMGDIPGIGEAKGLCVWLGGPGACKWSGQTSSWGKDNYWITSSSPTQLTEKFGAGYWVKGFCNYRTSPYSTHVYAEDEICLAPKPSLEGGKDGVYYQSGSSIQQKQVTSLITSHGFEYTIGKFANLKFSQSVGEFVSIYRPRVTLYEFHDSAEHAEFDFKKLNKAYGTAYARSGMHSQENHHLSFVSWGGVKSELIRVSPTGVETRIAFVSGQTDIDDNTAKHFIIDDVVSGDKVVIQFGYNTDNYANSAGYVWWSAKLPGSWDYQ